MSSLAFGCARAQPSTSRVVPRPQCGTAEYTPLNLDVNLKRDDDELSRSHFPVLNSRFAFRFGSGLLIRAFLGNGTSRPAVATKYQGLHRARD